MTTQIKNIMFNAILLLLGLTLYPATGLADRYNAMVIPSDVSVIDINNVGTLIFKDTTTQIPYYLRKEADTGLYDFSNRVELPFTTPDPNDETMDLSLNQALIIPTAINNEKNEGIGATIIGWYTDNSNNTQGLAWYQYKTPEEIYEYRLIILEPLEEAVSYCKNDNPESNFLSPECVRGGVDDRIIQDAKACAGLNANWETTGLFYLGTGNDTTPCESTPIPICEYKMVKVKTQNQEPDSENLQGAVRYDYGFNPDYDILSCMLREHAQQSVRASRCDKNDGWSFDPEVDTNPPLTYLTCDVASKANKINNNNTIFGVSYDSDGNPHPIAWHRSTTTEEGVPKYRAENIGINRADVTPESVVVSNQNRSEFSVEKSLSYDIQRRLGEVTVASSATADAAGFIRENDGDADFKPYYWRKVEATGYEPPVEIFNPDANAKNVAFAPGAPRPNLTTAMSGSILGWLNSDNRSLAASWNIVPQKDSNNIVTEVLTPKLEDMLEPNSNEGKILDGNFVRELVGTSKVTEDGKTSDRAFFKSSQCGIQDLNDLLVAPIADATSLLSQATLIGSGNQNNTILATGIDPLTTNVSNQYLLTQEDVFVNLKIDITTDHDRLTVGDQHSYFITLSNLGKPSVDLEANYATCVVFVLEASVFAPAVDENGIPKEELLAGLSFLRIESDPSVGLACQITPIRVICALDKLSFNDPPVTVKIITEPRPLLADRRIKATVRLFSTEKELKETEEDNIAFVITDVDRKGCFIATAAYGSYLSTEVKALRDFRDNILLQFSAGRWLVETYYDVSPTYADYISRDETLRMLARWSLSPLVYAVTYPMTTFILVIGLISILRFRRSK